MIDNRELHFVEKTVEDPSDDTAILRRIQCKGDSCDELRAEMPTKLGTFGRWTIFQLLDCRSLGIEGILQTKKWVEGRDGFPVSVDLATDKRN